MSTERIIHIDRLTYGSASDVSAGFAPAERTPLRPEEVWIDYAAIGPTPPTPAPWPGAAGAYTVGVLAEPLVALSLRRYAAATPGRIASVVPGAYAAAAGAASGPYAPRLADAGGRALAYDPALWLVDGVLGAVQLFRDPAALGLTPPLALTFWTYTGAIAAAGSGGTTVTAGDALAGANLGAAGVNIASVYAGKTPGAAPTLDFRRLVGGAGVLLTETADSITIAASGPAFVASMQNEGGGAGVYDTTTLGVVLLRSLTAGSGGLSVTENATTVAFDCTLEGENTQSVSVATATGAIYDGKVGDRLRFNCLAAGGGGLSVSTPSDGFVTVDCTLEGENIGTGDVAVYAGKAADRLQFRNIVGSSGIGVSQTDTDITIDLSGLDVANVGNGAEILKSFANGIVSGRTLMGAEPITVSQIGDSITVGLNLETFNTGTGAGILNGISSSAVVGRTLVGAGSVSVNIGGNDEEIIISTAEFDAINEGSGIGVIKEFAENTIVGRSIKAVAPVTASLDGEDIVISYSQPTWLLIEAGPTNSAARRLTTGMVHSTVITHAPTLTAYGGDADIDNITFGNAGVNIVMIKPGTYELTATALAAASSGNVFSNLRLVSYPASTVYAQGDWVSLTPQHSTLTIRTVLVVTTTIYAKFLQEFYNNDAVAININWGFISDTLLPSSTTTAFSAIFKLISY
jgi:hypothetical protein